MELDWMTWILWSGFSLFVLAATSFAAWYSLADADLGVLMVSVPHGAFKGKRIAIIGASSGSERIGTAAGMNLCCGDVFEPGGPPVPRKPPCTCLPQSAGR